MDNRKFVHKQAAGRILSAASSILAGVTGPVPRALRDAGPVPRILSAARAAELGVTPSALNHAVAARGWSRLARGFLLTVPGRPTRADWINIGVRAAGPTAALSGWDAARLAGLGARRPSSPEVLVLCGEGDNRLIGNVRIRPTPRPYDAWLVPGDDPDLPYVPVVGAARAVADASLQYADLASVRALVTSAVQKRRCTVIQLVAEVENAPRNYSGWLRRSVADLRDGARSIAEAEAIDILRRTSLPMFEANVPIVTVGGIELATVDLLWRELRAVVEIDSREFHFSEDDWKATMARHRMLGRYGVSAVHFPPSDVRTRPREFAAEVAMWLRARAAELRLAYSPLARPLCVAADGTPSPLVVPGLRG